MKVDKITNCENEKDKSSNNLTNINSINNNDKLDDNPIKSMKSK